MLFLLRHLGLGIGLILAASAILLLTDRSRRSGDSGRVKRVALLQHASIAVLDEGTDGTIDGLAEHGFRQGDNLVLERFNAQGNVGTSLSIANQMVNGDYDLLITISTASLQAVATANKMRRMNHVFGIVADPFSAGVGLDRDKPMQHPAYLVGQGIFLPVEESFKLARQMYPGLQTVGVVWNPAESNSLAFTTKAREVCKETGITLREAPVDNSAGVREAALNLIGQGVQAIWVGGDVAVSVAIDSLIAVARRAGIPVFTITPGKPDRGTLFDVGINFYDCGKLTGALAAEVLNGKSPASEPIRDVMDLVPHRLVVNRLALRGLKDPWNLPDDLVKRADIVIDEQGIHKKKAGR